MYSYYPQKNTSNYEVLAYESFAKALELTKAQINLST